VRFKASEVTGTKILPKCKFLDMDDGYTYTSLSLSLSLSLALSQIESSNYASLAYVNTDAPNSMPCELAKHNRPESSS
jgi:hypothetical protein